MVTTQKNVFNCAANFLRGRKCVFCGSFKVCKTRRGYIRCRNKSCGKQKSLKRLRREIGIVIGFYQQQPAYRVAQDLWKTEIAQTVAKGNRYHYGVLSTATGVSRGE